MSSSLKTAIKNKIALIFKLLPFGEDLLLLLLKSRQRISYSGLFEHFTQAEQQATKHHQYDIINKNKSQRKTQENETLDIWFPEYDYPLLFWTGKYLKENSNVLELGGSLGHLYYGVKRTLGISAETSWTIAELPEAVSLGRQLAKERNEHQLHFVESSDMQTANRVDLFITAGTIQYMPLHLWEELKQLSALPLNVIIHNLPCHANQEATTLQDLGACQVPYRIYSKTTLIREMSYLGYELSESWTQNRELKIPFHLSYRIEGYCGFVFKLESDETKGKSR